MSDDSHGQRQPPTISEGAADTVSDKHDDDAAAVTRVIDDGLETQPAGGSDDPETVSTIGRFRVVRCIGTGGMGVVYAAHDDDLDRDLAIKVLRSDLAEGTSGRQRLLREAQAIAKLSHPNVVHVYEVGHADDRVFMAMELVRGRTLRAWCSDRGRRWTEIVDMFVQAGEGLAAAHAESIVHRDFKPDNVIVADDGRPRVLDFGLARADDGLLHDNPDGSATTHRDMSSIGLTATGTVMGTPAYMAPEQLAQGEPDARTDQFAFCASLFEMLYGRRPFRGSTYDEIARSIHKGVPASVDPRAHGVSRALHAVILRGLSRKSDDRFPSMVELLAALRSARAGRPRRLLGTVLAAAAAVMVVAMMTMRDSEDRMIDAEAEPVDADTDAWAEIVAGTELPETVPTPIAGDPTGVTVHRLRNGLTVYVAPRPLEPNVAVTVAVRAGSEQERDYDAGLGFFVMNSVYQGTERLGVVDANIERPSRLMQQALLSAVSEVDDPATRESMLRAVAIAQRETAPFVLPNDLTDAPGALGGSSLRSFRGAGTTFEVRLPAHRVDAWLEIIAEAVRRPAFRNVLHVLQSQIARYDELTRGRLASQILQRELMAATDLREDYLRASKYMARIPLEDAKRFHTTYYRPNNTAVVFVGDITPTQAVQMCDQAFGSWEPAPIPKRPPADRPLPTPVVRHEIEDEGAPAVYMAWPLPPTIAPEHAALEALADALNRHDGLAAALRDATSGAYWSLTHHRSLQVRVVPLPGQSLSQAEAETIRALQAIAEDRLADEAWAAALARAELTRASWARTPEALAELIATSFIERGSWSDEVDRLTHPPSREGLVAAARALLSRPRVVVHKKTGPTTRLPLSELPFERMPEPHGPPSAFVRGLADSPVTPPEPRFLVEGSHYDVHPHGHGRVITSKRNGPLAFASWIYPVGVDTDPFVCDAVQARVRVLRVAGVDFSVWCTNDSVWVDIVSPTQRFEREAASMFEWLDHGDPTTEQLREYVARTLVWRTDMRNAASDREIAFRWWALRGEHGINAKMPRDAELERRGPQALLASLRRLGDRSPDVLYVGPSPQALRDALPPAQGGPRPPSNVILVRQTDEDIVFLLDDPDRERATVQVILPWPELDTRAYLVAQLHNRLVGRAAADVPAALEPGSSGWAWPWWSTRPLATVAAYESAHADVEHAVVTAVDLLRRPVPEDQFVDAHRRMEVGFRTLRARPHRVPETVLLWRGAKTDPRVEQWFTLPGLRYDDMRTYDEARANRPVIIAIIANAAQTDLATLERFGKVVRLSIADLDTLFNDHLSFDGP